MTGDEVIAAEINAAWAAHEGEREPGISDLEWQQHSTRELWAHVNAGPRGGALLAQQAHIEIEEEGIAA